jgi:hypothetical protein
MTPQDEHLDETIDRVAAALTMVPANPALAERIAARLQRETAHASAWRQIAFGAVAIGAAVLLAIMLNDDRSPSSQAPTHVAQQPAPLAAPLAPSAAREPAVTSGPMITVNVTRRRAPPPIGQAALVDADLPRIGLLQPPPLLAVDTLTNDPLTIAPVNVAPLLDLATLTINDMGERDAPKE